MQYLPARKGKADELGVKHTRQQPDGRYTGKSFRPEALSAGFPDGLPP